MVDTHQDTDLSFQAGGDFGVKVVVLHDDLDCVLHASLSVRASVHGGKVARSELRSAFVLAVKSLTWFWIVHRQSYCQSQEERKKPHIDNAQSSVETYKVLGWLSLDECEPASYHFPMKNKCELSGKVQSYLFNLPRERTVSGFGCIVHVLDLVVVLELDSSVYANLDSIDVCAIRTRDKRERKLACFVVDQVDH